MQIADLLKLTVEKDASDLHIVAGRPPVLRVDGKLTDTNTPKLSADDTRNLIYGILNDAQKQKFEDTRELDFSLSISHLSRFRVNVHFQRGSVGGSFRVIPSHIRSLQELRLPQVLEKLARRPAGMILVTGPTGSGKSTTLAAMLDLINSERQSHIITIEDPIEYLHSHKQALVEQREVNEDTFSFANALKFVLRQDPDIIMVGEMRDLETISAALTAAETGHLVLTTLHTNDVVQTIDRMIDVFPPHQQQQVRIQLASVLEGVLCQKLLPNAYGKGREISVEIMIATDAIRSLVREGKTHQVYSLIEAGGSHQMQTMDRAIADLFKKGKISRDVALSNSRKPEELKRHLYM